MDSLVTRQPRLSKSRVVSGLQCERRLWLESFRPELSRVDAGAQARFDIGHEVGDIARELFGPGTLIGHVHELEPAIAETAQLVAKRPNATLFEAAFRHGDVLVRADVLRPVDGGYDLIEVKASTAVKDYQIDDCAIQAWVIQNAGMKLRRIQLAHIDSRFVYQGNGNYQGLLAAEDVTDAVRDRMREVPGWVERLKGVLRGQEPPIRTGEHCHTPFDCPLFDYCRAQEPAGPEYPVTILPRAIKLAKTLQEEGYLDLCEVPASRLANSLHRRVQEVSVSQRPFLNPAAAAVMRRLRYPRYYLDFETVDFAVPKWTGTRPYQQIPFQWSCHIEQPDGSIAHDMFLDLTGEPPMRRFAESLQAAVGDSGPILVYNMAFEKTRIVELAAMLPDLAAPLQALVPRIVDLLPIIREHYYHPAMKGSWSIKKVFPTIAPDLDYGNLENVASSGDAPLAYLEATHPETTEARRAELDVALRRYCANDTLAMVKLAQALSREMPPCCAPAENNGTRSS